jgi:hypothetical protein
VIADFQLPIEMTFKVVVAPTDGNESGRPKKIAPRSLPCAFLSLLLLYQKLLRDEPSQVN